MLVEFQSHNTDPRFNPTLVRFELIPERFVRAFFTRFNPTLVRFELPLCKYRLGTRHRFQSHIGPI